MVPRLAESCRALDDQPLLSEALQQLRESSASADKAIALAAIHDTRIVNEVAIECLWNYVTGDKVLAQLIDAETLSKVEPSGRREALERVRSGLSTLISATHRYRCNECGYVTSSLLWQCPSCRSWETVVPVERLSLTSPIS